MSAAAIALALPPGWWNAATLPADVVQFFTQVIVVAQKLAYLYGWPEFVPHGEEVDDETRLVVTLFVGVALGSNHAAHGLAVLGERVGAEVAKRLSRQVDRNSTYEGQVRDLRGARHPADRGPAGRHHHLGLVLDHGEPASDAPFRAADRAPPSLTGLPAAPLAIGW